jgi:hypothetical protein
VKVRVLALVLALAVALGLVLAAVRELAQVLEDSELDLVEESDLVRAEAQVEVLEPGWDQKQKVE